MLRCSISCVALLCAFLAPLPARQLAGRQVAWRQNNSPELQILFMDNYLGKKFTFASCCFSRLKKKKII